MIPLRHLLLCFLCGWLVALCPAAYSPPDLQSGVVAASVAPNSDIKLTQSLNTYSYVLQNSFFSTPSVAVATTYLDGSMQTGQYYFIMAESSQQQSTTILFTANVSGTADGWSTIRFSFVASTRDDLQLGQIVGDLQPSSERLLSRFMSKSFQNPTVIALIAGFAISSTNFDSAATPIQLSIIQKQATGNNLQVRVLSNFASSVAVGYAVYSSTIAVNLAVTTSFTRITLNVNPNKKILQVNSFLYGTTEIVSPTKTGVVFEIRLFNNFTLRISSRSSATVLATYVLFQNQPQFYCSRCLGNPLFDGSGCVNVCSGNAVPQAITTAYSMCISCPLSNYMITDSTKSRCICADQYYPSGPQNCLPCHYTCASCNGPTNNNCLTCDTTPAVGTNRYLANGQCLCLTGNYEESVSGSCLACHYSCLTCNGSSPTTCLSCNSRMFRQQNGSSCSCNPGYIDDGTNALCQCESFLPNGFCDIPDLPPAIVCPLNSVNINGACQCNDPFVNISGSCLPCQENAEKASATSCRCKASYVNVSGQCTNCVANSLLINGRCQCSSNFVNISGSCSPCPLNSIKVGPSDCKCRDGFANSSGSCTPCPTGSLLVGDQCSCPPNTVLKQGACQFCPANSEIINGNCVCLNGYTNISGACTNCPTGSIIINGQCQCPTNTRVLNNQCQCSSGFLNSSGTCVACPANSQAVNNRCQCIQGFNNVSGQCVGCPLGSIVVNGNCQCASNAIVANGVCTACPDTFVSVNNTCGCAANYANIGGKCQMCPRNSVLQRGQCICNPGTFNISGACSQCSTNESYNPATQSCICLNGYSKVNGACKLNTIPISALFPNTEAAGGQIRCIASTFNVSGVCRSCSDNQNQVGNSCACKDGWAYIGGYCAKLGANEQVQNDNIVCKGGFVNILGACQTCDGRYNQADKTCDCSADNYVRINGMCRLNQRNCPKYSYLRGFSCACVPGASNISGSCMYCPVNSRSDGKSCVCLQGLQKIDGLCKCPTGAYFDGRSCKCNDGYISQPGGSCMKCPSEAVWDGRKGCICAPGSAFDGKNCIVTGNNQNNRPFDTAPNPPSPTPSCGPNSNYVNGRCQCNQGFVSILSGCVLDSRCPPGTIQGPNGCQCSNPQAQLINGVCLICPPNSYFNGKSCICSFGIYDSEKNVCRYCNPPAAISGNVCKCPSSNQVYIFDSCYSCHQSCSTCSGNTQSQCLTCPNQSPPVNGVCQAPVPLYNCPASSFFSAATNSCQSCMAYCIKCYNPYSCDICSSGFYFATYQCSETCGDGKRFMLPCDDGNLVNGDGCSSTCQIESGWTCSGGNSFGPDTCGRAAAAPLKPFSITVRDMYHMSNLIIVNFILSYIPDEMIQNGCQLCQRLLTSTVLDLPQQPYVQSAFSIPNMVSLIFNYNSQPIPPFRASVTINPQYSAYYSQYNLGQPLVVQINANEIPFAG